MKKALTKEQVKAIEEEAHHRATLRAIQETKDLNEDQLRTQLDELKVHLWELREKKRLLMNAFFVAKSENLPVADSLLSDDIEEDSIDQKIRNFLDEQLEKKEINQEEYDRMIIGTI